MLVAAPASSGLAGKPSANPQEPHEKYGGGSIDVEVTHYLTYESADEREKPPHVIGDRIKINEGTFVAVRYGKSFDVSTCKHLHEYGLAKLP